ncbi:MAG: hypothetical protein WC666_04250 [Candidatus Paceibacterota bacterium]|jgi:hypothetical protein
MARTSAIDLATAAGTANNGTAVLNAATISSPLDYYIDYITLTSTPNTATYNTTIDYAFTLNAGIYGAYRMRLGRLENYTVDDGFGGAPANCSVIKNGGYISVTFTVNNSTATFRIVWNDGYNSVLYSSAVSVVVTGGGT